MSDVTPFTARTVEAPASELEIFKPPLAGVDFVAYEARQDQLDLLLQGGDPEALTALIKELQEQDPDVGLTLNNLHNTKLGGNLGRLVAPLAIMTKTVVEADMRGLDFQYGVASEASFKGQNLRGANLIDTVTPGTDFSGADLRGADFTNAVLTGANFTDAQLEGADFSNAYMVDVTGLDEEAITRINLDGARVMVARNAGQGSIERLLASRFGDSEDIETIKAMLDPVKVAVDQALPRLFSKQNLRGLVGRNVRANDVEMSGSILIGALLEDFSANGVQLRLAGLSGMVIRGAVMRNADLFGAWAPGVILEDVNLNGARIEKANLVGAVLRDVDLRGVVGLDAAETHFEGIVLEGDCRLPQGYGYNGIAIEPSEKLKRELEQ